MASTKLAIEMFFGVSNYSHPFYWYWFLQVKCPINKNSIFSVYGVQKPCKMPRKADKNVLEFFMVFVKECILSKKPQ